MLDEFCFSIKLDLYIYDAYFDFESSNSKTALLHYSILVTSKILSSFFQKRSTFISSFFSSIWINSQLSSLCLATYIKIVLRLYFDKSIGDDDDDDEELLTRHDNIYMTDTR